jgi:coenzyme F420-dependent glucose-6-phosphate dehydrogenase
MVKFGFHASHEQHVPSVLLELVQQAERVGFRHAMCSDHFHPWSDRQGQSGFAWSWLGAALHATSLSFGTVCAPGQRYHPAIIAQATATLAEMYPGRFWLAVGSGEALNEGITGDEWPEKADRNARLKEAFDVIKALWAGDTVSHDGYFRVQSAKLYSRPAVPPSLFVAALTPETATWLAPWADGMITAGASHDGLKNVVRAFRENGGDGKPVYLQTAMCLGSTFDEALRTCHDQWRHAGLALSQISDLPTPAAFDAATVTVTERDLKTKLRISDSFNELWDGIERDAELGFTRIYLHHIGRDMTRFLVECERVLR